jgi:hypothetical protein
MKFACSIRGRTRGAGWAAPAKIAAIVSYSTCEARHFTLNCAPVEMSSGDSGLENHCGASSPFFDDEQALPISDFDPSATARVAPAIAARCDELVHAAENEKRREKADQQKNYVHSDAGISEDSPLAHRETSGNKSGFGDSAGEFTALRDCPQSFREQ